jgi:hypothetical protein
MLRFFVILLLAPLLGATGTLKVRILDADRHTTTAARVNIMGSDSAFYEPDPAQNPLSGYSLKRKGNRGNVTPLRYFGSFFYTEGAFEVKLPPGIARIEVSKGYSYYRSLAEVKIEEGKESSYEVVLQRVIDMPANGWHSTDTHLHFDRSEASADATIFQLLSAEDIELGHILTAQSAKGFGMASLNAQGRYSMVSGREATSAGLGHVNMLLFNQLPAAVRNAPSPPPGFPLASLYDQVLAAGGAMQHDHAGYGQEIYADAVLGKSDAVELLQFALYRPEIGIDGYYLLLNSGFRYPLLGASDYPVCRTMSDSRTFVADGIQTTFPTSVGRLLRGESFATSGPLLFLAVNGKGPGSDIEYSGESPQPVTVQVKAASGELPFDSLEIVQDGRVVSEWHGSVPVFQKELKATLKLSASSWIAARCSGPETVHAHTNPVWIYFNRRAPFQPEAARQLQTRIRAFANTRVSQAAKDVAKEAEDKVEKLLQSGAAPMRPAALTRFPVNSNPLPVFGTDILPPVLSRPKPLGSATVEGTAVDKSGQPLSGVMVSVRATGPSVSTDAAGHFRLSNVDANLPLFLRLSKPGYATTNTSYLNPRGARENLRVMLLTAGPHKTQATVIIGGAISGLTFTASPAGTTRFAADGTGTTEIKFQPAYPPQANDHEPNVIVSAEGMGKDIVLPVFPDQVSYGVVSGR